MSEPSKERQRFPLRFAMETGSLIEHGPMNAKEYRIEVEREYEVVSIDSAHKRQVRGRGRVEGIEGAFSVVLLFDFVAPYASRTFYAVWRVDGESIARLEEVLLIEGK